MATNKVKCQNLLLFESDFISKPSDVKLVITLNTCLMMTLNLNMEWNLKCRVCLQEEDDLTSLFDKDDANISYGRKLTECSSIIINRGLNYPEKICSSCIADLTIAYNFRINCERSNAILLSFFENQNPANFFDSSDNIDSSYKSNDFDLILINQQIKKEPIFNDTIEDKIIEHNYCLLQAIEEERDIEQSIKQEDEHVEQDSDSVLLDLKDPLDVNIDCDLDISDECLNKDSKNDDNLNFIYRNGETMLSVFQDWGVIDRNLKHPCRRCGRGMRLYNYQTRCVWRCFGFYFRNEQKLRCEMKYSIRSNTFFFGSHLSIQKILKYIEMWMDGKNTALLMDVLKISDSTVTDWNYNCIDIAINECLKKSKKIGGPGIIIEIHESKFGKKRNRSKNPIELPIEWNFCGIERDSGDFFMVTAKKRDRETLISLIETWILPGTLIHSELVKMYDILTESDCLKLNVEFLNRKNDKFNVTINESIWPNTKIKLPNYPRRMKIYDGYLARFLFTSMVKLKNLDPVETFMKASTYKYAHLKLQ